MLPPGLSVTGFKNDDAVYVGFVENDYTKPVILGKMVTKETETLEAGNIQAEAVTAKTLSITDTAAINKLKVEEKIECPNSFFKEIEQRLNIADTINRKLNAQMSTINDKINQAKIDMGVEFNKEIEKQMAAATPKANEDKDPAGTIAETTNQNNRFNKNNLYPGFGPATSTIINITEITGTTSESKKAVGTISIYNGKDVGTFLDKKTKSVERIIDLTSVQSQLSPANRFEIKFNLTNIANNIIKIDLNNTFLQTKNYVFHVGCLNVVDKQTYQLNCYVDNKKHQIVIDISVWANDVPATQFKPDEFENLYLTFEYTI